MFKELKNGIEISVAQAVFKLRIKTVITQEMLGFPTFWCYFEFLGQIYYKMQDVDNFEIRVQKHANFGVGDAVHP